MNAFVFAVMRAFKGKLDKPAKAQAEKTTPAAPAAPETPAQPKDASDKPPRT